MMEDKGGSTAENGRPIGTEEQGRNKQAWKHHTLNQFTLGN